MRNRVVGSRARQLSLVAVAAMLAGVAAGCSDHVTRFNEPLFTGSTANQREIIGSGQPIEPAVASTDATITKGDLPPLAPQKQ
jgi:hypothetical protein